MKGKYDDIIGLPHHVSEKRAPMPMIDRAAQFSPFAALTGYDATIEETARLTDCFAELTDGRREELDEMLRQLRQIQHLHPKITVTYFRPDEKKQGGAYLNITGCVKKVDAYAQRVIMDDDTEIAFGDIWMLSPAEP